MKRCVIYNFERTLNLLCFRLKFCFENNLILTDRTLLLSVSNG